MERFHAHAGSVRGMCNDITAPSTIKVIGVPVRKIKVYFDKSTLYIVLVYGIQIVSFTVKFYILYFFFKLRQFFFHNKRKTRLIYCEN